MESISNDSNLLYKEEVYRVIGAAMEVHKTLGYGFLEPVYQEALEIELGTSKIPFQAQKPLQLLYKGTALEKYYIADFCVFDKIIIEIKAVEHLDSSHVAQVINYLKATGFKLGLLINFGAKSLEWKRIVR